MINEIQSASCSRKIILESPIFLTGYHSKERELPILGFLDDILCIVNLLIVNQSTYLFISIDVCMIDQKNIDELKKTISDYMSISSANIFISATHTHSGPSGLDNGDYSYGMTEGILDIMINTIKEMVAELELKKEFVEMYLWQGEIEGIYGNRNDASLPSDKSVSILKLQNLKGDIVSMFATFNCHPTVYGPNTTFGTADIIGRVRQKLEEFYGNLPLVFLGACGDVSCRNYRLNDDYNEVKRIANEISKQMCSTNFEKIPSGFNISKKKLFSFVFHLNSYKSATEKSLKKIEESLVLEENYTQIKLLNSEKKILEDRLKKDKIYIDFECFYIDLGMLKILTIPGEIYSSFGIYLKSLVPNSLLWIMTLTNGYVGYLTEKSTYGNYYESIVSPFPSGKAEEIIKEIGEML